MPPSQFGRYFELKERKSSLSVEIRAGTVTFLSMAYILAVNAGIVADTGGACSDADCTGGYKGPFCRFGDASGFDAGYMACREQTRLSMISATAASSLIACFLMGAMANMPLGLAPGMGINAFFTYTVVGFFGSGGLISYKQAVAAVFIEGWIFVFIALTGVRGKLIQLVPKSVMLATAGGIGIFLAFIGLQGSEGLGMIVYDSATLVTLGGCPYEKRLHSFTPNDPNNVCSIQNGTNPDGSMYQYIDSSGLGPGSPNYSCDGMRMRSSTMWLGIFGGMMMVLLMGRNIKGSIMIGILFVTFVSWIQGHGGSFLGAGSQIPGGADRLTYFKKVVTLPNTAKTALAWEWSAFKSTNLWAALISFLYLDFLDTTGTLFSMATFLDKQMPGFIDQKTKRFPRQTAAFCVDGISIIVAGLLGRTGITAITIAFYFGLSLFFTPIIASIPPFATGPALVLVGAMMMENLLDIRWHEVQHSVPAFLTIALIPLTYSIAFGVIAGITTYVFLYVFFLLWDLAVASLTSGGKTVREVLADAVPDAFQPDREPSVDESLPEKGDVEV
ncbi:MAG: hypothetical protein WDW38_006075 [Sanguina aurantia]